MASNDIGGCERSGENMASSNDDNRNKSEENVISAAA